MKSMSLKEKSIQEYLDYVNSLKIHDDYKKSICNLDFIEQNPEFYLYYPKLFSNVFGVNERKLNNLCIAGYLYYQSTLFLDSLIDENDKSIIALITICQEEAIKILTHLFGVNSNFWESWNTRRNEYFKAVALEKTMSKKEINNVNFSEYCTLADFKASFGKSAIDSLFFLSTKTKEIEYSYNSLLKSHKYFSVAYQLNDDVLDFQKDYENRQFNWAVHRMKKGTDFQNYDIKELKKIFYIEGRGKEMFEEAINYINKAISEVDKIDVPIWKEHLKKLKLKFSNSIIEIDNYLKLLKTEIKLSTSYLQKNDLQNSIEIATDFIKDKQDKKGFWNEYINQGGISDIWSTAFITSKISSTSSLRDIFESTIDKSLNFLKRSKTKNSLWGYSNTWIEDADSTNFVLLSYLLNNYDLDLKTLTEWLKFKQENLFRTYRDKNQLLNSLKDKNINNVDGWASKHLCVSAVAFYIMILLDSKHLPYRDLKSFFDKQKITRIDSYWWTDSIYTYYYLALAYSKLGDSTKVKEYQQEVIKNISKDGYYVDLHGKNLFYTGLALEILLLDKNNHKERINNCVTYLLSNQYEDGSWENSSSLLIPSPEIINYQKQKTPVSTHGVNVRAMEFSRLFTTASIIKPLTLWREEN